MLPLLSPPSVPLMIQMRVFCLDYLIYVGINLCEIFAEKDTLLVLLLLLLLRLSLSYGQHILLLL